MSAKTKFTKVPIKYHLLIVLGISLSFIYAITRNESPSGDVGTLLTFFITVPVVIPSILISTSLTWLLFAKMKWLLKYPVAHYILVYASGIILAVVVAVIWFRLKY